MEEGMILDSRYQILSVIGQGGMSTIYLAEDLRLHKQWAIKAVDKKNHQAYLAIKQEMEVLKNLDHPSLIHIIDCIDEIFTFYIVMDYISGNSLEDHLKNNGPFTVKEAVEIGLEICEVIDYLHSQHPPMIYRDMKPGNVMLKGNGQIVLIDLGIAREYSSLKNHDTTKLGTREFAAPEQFEGVQSDERTDIYSIGKTIYALLTYSKSTIDIDLQLSHILHRCTYREMNRRYASVQELIQDLQSYQYTLNHPQTSSNHKGIRYLFLMMIFLLTITLGLALLEVRNSYQREKYNTMMLEYNYSEDSQYLLDAINYDPQRSDAYFSLIEAFKSDDCFDLDEESILKETIEIRLNSLSQFDFFEELSFEIGKLYWYYYENTDDEIRIQLAYRYMKYADCKESAVYNQIASFVLGYHTQIIEGEKTGNYADYFNQLISLSKTVSKEGNNYMILQSDNQLISVILTYYPRLINDGVLNQSIENTIDSVKEEINLLELSDADLEESRSTLLTKIELAYEVVKEEL